METKIIGIASGKGGVGKSFTALNLAVEMAVQQKKILLIDADVGLGNLHIMIGKKPEYTIVDLMDGKVTLEESLIDMVRGNLKVLAGGSGLEKIFHISTEKKKKFFNEMKKAQRNFDLIIVDIGAGINKEVISFLELADEAIIVTNPDITALADAYALLKTIVGTETITKNIGVIINKADEDLADEVFKKIQSASEKFLKTEIKLLGNIEDNRTIAYQATQKRMPVYYLSPNSAVRKQFYNLSLKIYYNKELHYNKGSNFLNKFIRFLGIEG